MKHNFRELKIWQKSKELVKIVYKVTGNLPEEVKFGLTTQIRRSSISIPSNIAEGSGRTTIKEFSHFLDIAKSSSYELETQLIISNDLQFITENELNEGIDLLHELQKMIYSFQNQLI